MHHGTVCTEPCNEEHSLSHQTDKTYRTDTGSRPDDGQIPARSGGCWYSVPPTMDFVDGAYTYWSKLSEGDITHLQDLQRIININRGCLCCSARQTAVASYLTSKQLLLFVFALPSLMRSRTAVTAYFLSKQLYFLSLHSRYREWSLDQERVTSCYRVTEWDITGWYSSIWYFTTTDEVFQWAICGGQMAIYLYYYYHTFNQFKNKGLITVTMTSCTSNLYSMPFQSESVFEQCFQKM